jgi:hypothetical protein
MYVASIRANVLVTETNSELMLIQPQPRSLPGAEVKIKATQMEKELMQTKQQASKVQIIYTIQQIIIKLSYLHSLFFCLLKTATNH